MLCEDDCENRDGICIIVVRLVVDMRLTAYDPVTSEHGNVFIIIEDDLLR